MGYNLLFGGINILFSKKKNYYKKDYFKWFLYLSLILIIPGIVLAHVNYTYASTSEKGLSSFLSNFKISLINLKNIIINHLTISYVNQDFIDIPIYKLYVKGYNIDKLNSQLPPVDYFGITHAPKEYVTGHFKYNDTIYESKVRYRGDNYFHWRFPKKSWRVKPKDKKLFQGLNKLNFINPKFDSHMNTQLSYYMGERIGLIVPRSYHVALFINNVYYGVYYYTDQEDETFLRLNDKLPGDIYKGEITDDFINLFDHPEIWELDATEDNDEIRAKNELDFYLKSIEDDNLINFYKFFNRHIGNEHIKFDALTMLTASYQPDQFHNQKIYLNPSNARFEPFVWDLMPFLDEYIDLSLNYFNNPLILKMHLIPEFVNKRNKIIYDYMNGELSEENLIKIVDEWKEKIEYEMSYDKYKDSKEKPNTLTMKGWGEAVEKLKENIKKRYEFLRNSLSQSEVIIYVTKEKVIFDVGGESAVKYNNEILYPGRKIKEKPIDWMEIFKNELAYSKLRYEYDLMDKFDPSKIKLTNAITGEKVIPKIIYLESFDQLSKPESTDSLHPFELNKIKKSGEIINLEGNVILDKNLIINKEDKLIIKPGTTINLGKDVSIISYGQIIAKGIETNPIIFTKRGPSPWGSIVMQGIDKENSKPNHFEYCIFDGGSGAYYERQKYTGQVCVYNSEAYFENSKFLNSKIEDDNFNAKYSHIEIINSEFDNSPFDAIDLDVSEGKIINSKIINSGNDCIDLMTSSILIENNKIINCGDKGISIGERSHPKILNNEIINCEIGLAVKDMSDPIIANNIIELNNIAIAAYHKNWRYEYGGRGKIYINGIKNNLRDYSIDEFSKIVDERKNLKLNTSKIEIIDEAYKNDL